MYKIVVGAAFSLLFSNSAMALCSSYPYTLTNGTTADASQVMANLNCAALTSGATINSPNLSGNVGIDLTGSAYPLAIQVPDNTVALKLQTSDNSGTGTVAIRVATPNDSAYQNLIFSAASVDFVTSNNQALFLANSGYVGVNTTSPSYPLHVNGTAYATGAAGALSDMRHKKDVVSLGVGALDEILRLRPVSFLWKQPTDAGMQGRQIGFVAQEVEKIFPTVVLTENNAEKTKGLKYNELIAVLTKAVQEQQEEIQQLQVANDNARSSSADLLIRLSSLERRVSTRTAQK